MFSEEQKSFDPQELFAERIGGRRFGEAGKVFKFTLIERAKHDFVRQNPSVKVIDLGVGEPEERAPDRVAARLYEEALLTENRIYPNNGTPPFKEAAARYLKRLLALEFDPESEIVHCVGSKTALAQVPFVFLNPGDSLITTTPGYPVLPTIAGWLNAQVHYLPLLARNRYLPDLDELTALAKRTRPKLLLLNYPNNPTGGVASSSFYQKAVELAHQFNFAIVQDAAYADLVYEGSYVSPLQVDGGREVCLELYSLSKSFNMQGYRLGFVVSSPLLLKAFALVKDNIDNGQFIAIQKAGVEALDNAGDCIAENRAKYRRRLEKAADIFRRAGFQAQPSPGTFYLYLPVPVQFKGQTFESAQACSDYLITELGIVTVPWEENSPHIRLSMTFEIAGAGFQSEEEVFAAIERRLVQGRF